MKHTFDIDVAKEFGVNAAVLFQNIAFMCENNRLNGVNFHDGNYWTFNSRKAIAGQYIYLSEKQVRTALDRLVDGGMLIKGNYNKLQFDKTLWYALTDEGRRVYTTRSNPLPLKSNGDDLNGKGLACNGEAIPDINSYINTDINHNKNTSYSCSEPEKSGSKPQETEPAEPVVYELELNDGSMYGIPQSDYDKYVELYPAVDVMQQFRKMTGWIDASPNNRKTRKGIKKFINGWLSREQDKGSGYHNNYQQPSQPKGRFDRSPGAEIVPWGDEEYI